MTNDLVKLIDQVKVTRRIHIPKWVSRYIINKYILANKPKITPLIDYQV